ncbi:MAG: PH domain-containing protein [Allosphingosinicella sp.]
MKPLERGQLQVFRVHAILQALVLAALAAAGEVLLAIRTDFPPGMIAGPVFLLILYLVILSPGRQYRAWGYWMDSEDLRLSSGVWIRTEVLVPLDRVQHIDLSQGPIEKGFGVSRLIVHTAGTQYSRVALPGLSRQDAERMRDEIRARIGREEG